MGRQPLGASQCHPAGEAAAHRRRLPSTAARATASQSASEGLSPPHRPWGEDRISLAQAPSSTRARVVGARCGTLDFLGSRQVGAVEYSHRLLLQDGRDFTTSNHLTATARRLPNLPFNRPPSNL